MVYHLLLLRKSINKQINMILNNAIMCLIEYHKSKCLIDIDPKIMDA